MRSLSLRMQYYLKIQGQKMFYVIYLGHVPPNSTTWRSHVHQFTLDAEV